MQPLDLELRGLLELRKPTAPVFADHPIDLVTRRCCPSGTVRASGMSLRGDTWMPLSSASFIGSNGGPDQPSSMALRIRSLAASTNACTGSRPSANLRTESFVHGSAVAVKLPPDRLSYQR
jgi:hypothetical protein